MPKQEPTYEFEQMKNALQEKGIDDPATKELLIAWTRMQEEKVANGATPEVQVLAQIDFERLRARLYYESGYREEDIEAYNDALRIAIQEGFVSVQTDIENEINDLK